MAKKVILKDENLIEVMPITRGELILDSSGNPAFHSSEFLATDSQPGLMSAEDKYKIINMQASSVANALTLKINNGSVEGTNLYTYNGSVAKTLNIIAGDNITLTPTDGVLSISANIPTINDVYTKTESDNRYFKTGVGFIEENDLDTFVTRGSGTYNVVVRNSNGNVSYSYPLISFRNPGSSGSALEFVSNYQNTDLKVRTAIDNKTFTNWETIAFKSHIPTSLPANGGNADMIDGYHMDIFGHYKYSKTIFDTTNSTWYIKVTLGTIWNYNWHHLYFRPTYNNICGQLELELPTWDDTDGYVIKTSSYNQCNISGIRYIYDGQNVVVYLRLAGYTEASCVIYSTCEIISASVVSDPNISFIDVKSPAIQTNYSIYAKEFYGTSSTATSLFYLRSDDATLKIYPIAGLNASVVGNEAVAIQTAFDGKDPTSTDYPINYPDRTVLSLQPRGGRVGIGTTSPGYKLTIVSYNACGLQLLENGRPESSIIFSGSDGNSWIVGKGVGGYDYNNTFGWYTNKTLVWINSDGTINTLGNIYIESDKALIQKLVNTSNYTSAVEWYKGGTSNATWDPQIGQHNTGGSEGTGSICILPYATETDPWSGSVGLFLSKTQLLFEGNTVLHTGNYSLTLDNRYYTETEADNRFVNVTGDTMTGNLTFSTDSSITWSRNTDYASIRFQNTGDGDTNLYLDLQTGDNGNEYIRFSRNGGGTVYEMASFGSDGARISGNLKVTTPGAPSLIEVYSYDYVDTYAGYVGHMSTGDNTLVTHGLVFNTSIGTSYNGASALTLFNNRGSNYYQASSHIFDSGNVGIGTIYPEYKLHTVGKIVAKSTQNSVRLIPDEDCGLYMTSLGQWIHIAGSGREMYIYNGTWDSKGTGNYNKGIIIDETNKIGMGIAPLYKLDVNGTIRANGNVLLEAAAGGVSGGGISFWNGSGWVDGTINASKLVLNNASNGRVGIGTTDPQAKLDVDGYVRTKGIDVTEGGISWPQETSATWETFGHQAYQGLKILNTIGQPSTGAPSSYAVGLSVSGYYGFCLAYYGGGKTFWLKGSAEDGWEQIIHTGNIAGYVSSLSVNADTVDGYHISVVNSLPANKTNNTIYILI